MSAPWGPQMKDQLQGFNDLHQLDSLLTDLHEAGTVRDRAGNRHLFYDQYALLLLLYFFNPTITSLRGLQRTTDLSKVQQLGIHRTALRRPASSTIKLSTCRSSFSSAAEGSSQSTSSICQYSTRR